MVGPLGIQYDAHHGDNPEAFSFQKFATVYSLPDNAVPCNTIDQQNG